jgi:PhnB protein
MKLSAHLNFNGNCAEAFAFYAQCLGGTITFTQKYGDSPVKDQMPPEVYDQVMHSTLALGDMVLMGCDAPSPRYAPPQGIQVSISVPNAADAERIFKGLAEGGKITMPFAKTFWSPGFGMAVDRFGIPWMVNTDAPA